MSYLSLARKYRPKNFDEIVGQAHIATTLKNAVSMDRVAHAYLFTGPRGVGKTSTARILAKSLDCEKGPTATPCDKCSSCEEIRKGINLDVIEIDGASNRGIDEIRNLRENIKFSPVRGKFKIYIIDEVHMLTQEAFNALLKTLEEPPLHVKFIFATTRPYKVLPTIVSRCQRFDFRKIPSDDIAKKLGEIKKKEKLNLDEAAIFLIAKSSDGSLRDAEVILDQLLSFTKGRVKTDDVAKVLGLLEQGILFELVGALTNNDKNEVLDIINRLIDGGKDPVFITTSIIDHFRNLMVAKVAKEKAKTYIALSDEDYQKLEEQSGEFTLDEILYITYTLSTALDLIRKTSLSRVPLEIALIKLTDRKRLTSLKDVLDKLSLMEKGLPVTNTVRKTKETSAPQVLQEPETLKEPELEPEEMSIPTQEISAERDILLLQKIKDSWAKILGFVKAKKMSIATFLAEAEPIKVKEHLFTIGFKKGSSLHKETLEQLGNKQFVEEAIQNILGEKVSLRVETLEGAVEGKAPAKTFEKPKIEDIGHKGTSKIDPIVESAIDIFDARIVDIKEKKKEEGSEA
ncbi:DNA polymerase III subunit gamma/tau [Candidatus Omnitrophota bacterium]